MSNTVPSISHHRALEEKPDADIVSYTRWKELVGRAERQSYLGGRALQVYPH